jgi:hypothetical protein
MMNDLYKVDALPSEITPSRFFLFYLKHSLDSAHNILILVQFAPAGILFF